jgi:hypothetical protein
MEFVAIKSTGKSMRNSIKSFPSFAQAALLLPKSSAKSLQEEHHLLVFSFSII